MEMLARGVPQDIGQQSEPQPRFGLGRHSLANHSIHLRAIFVAKLRRIGQQESAINAT
jgi:hypothetical protein